MIHFPLGSNTRPRGRLRRRRVADRFHDLQVDERLRRQDEDATLDDLREAESTLKDAVRLARRVLGGENPFTRGIERSLQKAQAALRAREAPPTSA